MQTQPNYEQQIILALGQLPTERKAEVLDFVLWLQTRVLPIAPDLAENDPLNATEEEMVAEDAIWDAITARHMDKLDKWAAKIENDVLTGRVTGINDAGDELVPIALPHKEAA